MSKILVVEDDAYLRRDLKEILIKNKYDVVTASSVGEACSYVNQEIDFDLYLLDLWLPDGEGFEICRMIRRKNQKPVIFLTVCDDEECVIKGLNIGADDYVTKPFRIGELLSRIGANLRRTSLHQNNDILQSKELTLDIRQGIVVKNNEEFRLSQVEVVILQKLMENGERIIKREQLLDTLWDNIGNCVEDNTLSVNISRIRNKIGGEFIETIRGFGYRFTEKVQRGLYENE
jgi:DNA-binding response OmpR family regulator